MDVNKAKGFTLIEIIIVIALITLLAALVAPAGIDFYQDNIEERQALLLKTNLEKARDFAIAGKLDSSWGVKFYPDDQECTDCYVFFKGNSYKKRIIAYDKVFTLSSGIDIEGMSEVVFEKITGEPHIY